MTTEFLALGTLLSSAGWRDASTDDSERLSARAGNLGLIMLPGSRIELISIDPWNGGTSRIIIEPPWTCGMVAHLAAHLAMMDDLRRAGI